MVRVFEFLLMASILFAMPISQSCNQNAGARESEDAKKVAAISENQYPILSEEFKNYWYAGKAELCSYKLKQARYGEIHDGYAVTIFVTEDFSKQRQVKLDRPEAAGNDRLPVMKLNLVKKFNTGIYPYSMMLSVFSPVDIQTFPHPVKTTASVQEWCGMTFGQLNNNGKNYHVQWNSYFESEGDQEKSFDICLMEDELWNMIRFAPDKLPTGAQKILPGHLYTRLSHVPLEIKEARLTLEEKEGNMVYSIDYPSEKHTLNITFEKSFPYKILGWDETFPGFDGKLLTTTARLDKSTLTDYWNHHTNADRVMREELDLPENYQ